METKQWVLSEEMEMMLPNEAKSMIKSEAFHLTLEIEALKVTNRENYEKAVELGIANSKILKRIEDFRKMIVDPLNKQVKNINSMFKKLSEKFNQNDEIIRKAIGSYQEKVKVEPIKTVHNDLGRATVVERWTYEITDPNAVPREWCIPDESRIGRAVRAGALTELSGVRIYKEKTTSFVAA